MHACIHIHVSIHTGRQTQPATSGARACPDHPAIFLRPAPAPYSGALQGSRRRFQRCGSPTEHLCILCVYTHARPGARAHTHTHTHKSERGERHSENSACRPLAPARERHICHRWETHLLHVGDTCAACDRHICYRACERRAPPWPAHFPVPPATPHSQRSQHTLQHMRRQVDVARQRQAYAVTHVSL